MKLIQIDEKTCNQDGICAAVCPAGLFDFKAGHFPVPVTGAETICIRCGHCVAVCPTGSLSHREMPKRDCPPVRPDLHVNPVQCEHFLRSRRSIRVYKNRAVPHEEIRRLIEIARYAPSGRNLQCVEWLVIDNKQALRQLAGIVIDWMRWIISNKPEVARSMNMDRSVAGWESGRDVILRDAPALIVAHAPKDNPTASTACIIALTYLELAAVSMKLGCCWAGYFTAAATTFPPMNKALKLPDGHQCFGAMMIGYPKFTYHRLPVRKEPPITWR
jgi:nitroreductase/NAD-dependent dihydropyrimidine dehydrogenase PreA subunit